MSNDIASASSVKNLFIIELASEPGAADTPASYLDNIILS
jgi:hypothetical protein